MKVCGNRWPQFGMKYVVLWPQFDMKYEIAHGTGGSQYVNISVPCNARASIHSIPVSLWKMSVTGGNAQSSTCDKY